MDGLEATSVTARGLIDGLGRGGSGTVGGAVGVALIDEAAMGTDTDELVLGGHVSKVAFERVEAEVVSLVEGSGAE